jgi:hypothetical protein
MATPAIVAIAIKTVTSKAAMSAPPFCHIDWLGFVIPMTDKSEGM